MGKKWKEEKLDALIMPPYIGCSFKHENAGDMGVFLDYSVLWNGLNYPAGVLPVTKVQEGDWEYSDTYNDMWTRMIKED